MMKELNILGRKIPIAQLDKSQLKGITVGEWLGFRIYDGTYHGVRLLFMEPKQANPSPRICSITANRLSVISDRPVVFILASGPSYERQRLIDKDVFFVMGDKFANLPMLVANERIRKTKLAVRLTPVAQYILLYHLQVDSLEGWSASDMEGKLPYSYASITLGLTCLADLGLCEKLESGVKSKIIHFPLSGKELWNKAKSYMISPVEKRLFCDGINSDNEYAKCGINALSYYSRLNPDKTQMIMMSRKEMRIMSENGCFHNLNEFDGSVMIEVWKYPVVSTMGVRNEWVDKLSLVISLKDDPDARVEGEVERVINEMKWLA